MWQNYETWLVLAALAVCIVAILGWIKDAGDDWLSASDSHWDTNAQGQRSVSTSAHDSMAGGQHAGT